jgi:hypothetical protein
MPATDPVPLSDQTRMQLVQAKVTCPFLGPAVATQQLAVRNAPDNPLASIEDIRVLGNTGGGDLGDLLVLFAQGNHAVMRGPSDRLTESVPNGFFSLELPGSQGSHRGHSGILQGDPRMLGSGRLSMADFQRLLSRAEGGCVKRSSVGSFIAENLLRDPDSKVFGMSVVGLLASDLNDFVLAVGPGLLNRLRGAEGEAASANRELLEKLTKVLGDDNLVGSAGEFGLLFAFLANKPGAQRIEGEPALSVQDLHLMFVDKRLPEGWQTWKKTRLDWVRNTTALALAAGREYLRLKKAGAG